MLSLNDTQVYSKTPTGNEYYKNETLKNDIYKLLDENDVILLNKLNKLRINLSTSNLNIKSIKEGIKELSNFNKIENYEYLMNLMRPERAKGCKIPSQVPVPSCSFQMHNCVTIKTNSSGNCAFLFNPFFMASKTALGVSVNDNLLWTHSFFSTLWVNSDDSLTGNAPNDNWVPMNINQTLPYVYDQYRLVSGSIVVRYVGKLDSAQGVVGGAVIFDDANSIGGMVQTQQQGVAYDPNGVGVETICPEFTKYGDFELARDSYYHQENSCLEGIRMLYFPIDNSYEEYTKVLDNTFITVIDHATDGVQYNVDDNMYRNGFNWMFFAQSCPQSSNCFKVDIYLNFECLPAASFLNYMPVTVNPYLISAGNKKKCIMMIQNKPIGKVEEKEEDGVVVPDIFEKMIYKFKNGLPSFERLAAWGLINAVPGLKSGLALAGNMITTNMMDFE